MVKCGEYGRGCYVPSNVWYAAKAIAHEFMDATPLVNKQSAVDAVRMLFKFHITGERSCYVSCTSGELAIFNLLLFGCLGLRRTIERRRLRKTVYLYNVSKIDGRPCVPSRCPLYAASGNSVSEHIVGLVSITGLTLHAVRRRYKLFSLS